MAVDLRPLTLGELLDRSFSLYRTHLPTFVVLMLPFAAVNALLSIVVQIVQSTATAREATPQLVLGLAGAAGLVLLLIPALILAHVIGSSLVTCAASASYLGEPATVRDAFARVRPKLGSLISLTALVLVRVIGMFALGMLVLFGFIGLARATMGSLGEAGVALGGLAGLGALALTAIGMLFLLLRYSLSVAALVNEALAAPEALARSIALVQGQLPRALVIIVFGVIISQIAGLLLQGPFVIAILAAGAETALGFGLAIVGAVAASLAGAVAVPLTTVALVVLYFDARARHEGYDLELLIDAIEPAPAAHSGAHSTVLG